MWIGFFAALVLAAVLLYVPGYLFFRGLRLSRLLAFCVAPLASLLVYSLLPIAYYELGIPCGLATVALPALLLGAGIYTLNRLGRLGNAPELRVATQAPIVWKGHEFSFDKVMLLVCISFGTALCAFMFVCNLPHPDVFFSRFDNQTHLNLVRAFLDSGKWSSLHTSGFLASTAESAATGSVTGGFYPATWHDLIALVCLSSSTSITVASNATIALVCALTSPTCLYLLMRTLLKSERTHIVVGTLFVCASSSFPWTFVLKGPTWPDMLASILVAAAIAVVVLYVRNNFMQTHPLAFVAFCLCAITSIAFLHPNSVFTSYVFFAAYGMHHVWHMTSATGKRPLTTSKRVLVLALCVIALATVWVLLHFAPPLQGILSYRWKQNSGVVFSLSTLVSFGFDLGRRQPILTLGAVTGIVYCIRSRRIWLLFCPAFFALCYVAAGNDWQLVNYWLGSFWYMTPYRFATRIFVFSLPIIAMGLGWITTSLYAFVAKRTANDKNSRLACGVCVAFVAIACIVNYAPISRYNPATDSGYESSFARVHRLIHAIYADDEEHVYSPEEVQFVNKAIDLVGKDVLVLNSPNDGSMFAYGVNGLNAYYRNQGVGALSEDAKLIAQKLNEMSTNKDVRDAVNRTGARYVLQLDHGVAYSDGVWLPQYKQWQTKTWAGIDAVDDKTPGFSVVLSEGDQMRLYRIDS